MISTTTQLRDLAAELGSNDVQGLLQIFFSVITPIHVQQRVPVLLFTGTMSRYSMALASR